MQPSMGLADGHLFGMSSNFQVVLDANWCPTSPAQQAAKLLRAAATGSNEAAWLVRTLGAHMGAGMSLEATVLPSLGAAFLWHTHGKHHTCASTAAAVSTSAPGRARERKSVQGAGRIQGAGRNQGAGRKARDPNEAADPGFDLGRARVTMREAFARRSVVGVVQHQLEFVPA
jgi:hypothetical protein